jgi:hypothetical protein
MMGTVAVKAFATGALILCSAGLASAQVQHWRHHARYAHARRIYSPSQAFGGAMTFKPAHPYQIYAGYDGRVGYGGAPENPLVPMLAAAPPLYHSGLPCYSLDDCARKDYDESGTIGRLGLGASPYHPEGPGNPR